jgi:copper chaperone CopZ
MKNILFTAALFSSSIIFAQSTSIKTVTLHVSGNCGECKERIENAADIKGVKLATWDAKTKILNVTYREDKVSILKIEKAILAAGHDTDTLKANTSAYDKLPTCCKYRSKTCEK